MSLRMGWLLEFIDKPADGLEFRFWSGKGDLTFEIDGEDVTYKGINGVVDIYPPNETANESVRMIAKMDASDPNIREQLRRDLGPLKIRLRWIYESVVDLSSNDGITPFTNLGFWWREAMVWGRTENNLTTNEVIPIRFRNVGDEENLEVGVTYYGKVDSNVYAGNGLSVIEIFDTESNATSSTGSPFIAIKPGKILITGSDSSNISVGRFDSSQVVEGGVTRDWVLSGKQFVGRLSAPTLSGGLYTIEVESLIGDLDRGRIHIWSHDAHIKRQPGDKALEYMREYKDGIDTKWPP